MATRIAVDVDGGMEYTPFPIGIKVTIHINVVWNAMPHGTQDGLVAFRKAFDMRRTL